MNWVPTPAETAAVALGGAAGAYLRLLLGRGLLAAGVAVPWPTFGINLLGSFALGLVAVWCRDRPTAGVLLGAGVCGGFTTFSAFGLEVVRLLEAGRGGTAAGYALASVLAGVAGAWVGLRVAGAAGGG